MKKLLTIILSVLMIMSLTLLAACGEDSSNKDSSDSVSNSVADSNDASNSVQNSETGSSASQTATNTIQKGEDVIACEFNSDKAKKVFFAGQTIVTTGLNVLATKTDNFKYTLAAKDYDVITPSDINELGTHEITIKVGAFEHKYDVQVILKPEVKNNEIKLSINPTFDGVMSTLSNDGYNQFKTISDMLNVTSGVYEATVKKSVKLAAGTYNEKLTITEPNFNFVGDTAKNTIISYGDCSSKVGGTDATATVTIKSTATDFSAKNISFINSYDYLNGTEANKQALAVLADADRSIFTSCEFWGYQDTLQAKKGRQYYKDCFITGMTDFIFGNNATALFENCEVKTRFTVANQTNNGYITAQKGNNGTNGVQVPAYGYVFKNCRLTADTGVGDGTVSLGRPWRADATVAYLNCEMGAHISKLAFDASGKHRYESMSGGTDPVTNKGLINEPQNAHFYEFGNTGAGSITEAVLGCSMLDQTTADKYTAANIFATTNGGVTYTGTFNPVA